MWKKVIFHGKGFKSIENMVLNKNGQFSYRTGKHTGRKNKIFPDGFYNIQMTSSNMASHLIVTHRETSMFLSIKFEIGIFIDGTIFICKKLSK